MSLTDLWINSRKQIEGKHLQQIIAFAGDGKLRDEGAASKELRDFLSHIPSDLLQKYLDECLEGPFTESGLVLQDIVNQIGRRIGFTVVDGRYRGAAGYVGFDGMWKFPDGRSVIVEVKTTDAYQISLDTIAKYRRELIVSGQVTEDNSSILIVIGRGDKDTSDLEAQIRGSRQAWNIRLISVDALTRLMTLKENVEDPKIVDRIAAILIPREFTRLDAIIDLVFSTAEDVKDEAVEEPTIATAVSRKKPVDFYDACIKRIEKKMKHTFVKRSITTYSSPDDSVRLTCALSKTYKRGAQSTYWFAFHPYQQEFLTQAATASFVAFGCGSEQTLVVIPYSEFSAWLDQMNRTENEKRRYWHVSIIKDGDKLTLHRKQGAARVDLNKFLVK
jgi:hypothetical protein